MIFFSYIERVELMPEASKERVTRRETISCRILFVLLLNLQMIFSCFSLEEKTIFFVTKSIIVEGLGDDSPGEERLE